MADIATLGLQVESSGVDKGTKSLQQLTNAAAKAEAAAQGLSGATKNAGAAAASVATGANNAAAALNRESVAATKAAGALKMHAVAANSNTQRLGGSMSGLAAQFQDIGVTAAMGMNPLIIALQQGTQIAGQMEMAMQSGASATGVFAQAFRSLISPVALASIALTALAAAGLQLVDWPALAASAINGLASALETIAPYAAMVAAGIALIYAPAIIGGIISLIGVLAQLSVAAISLAASFAAANPALAFVLGITAAVAAANIFRDELTQIFGVDIVGVAATAINQIIGAFVGGFNAIRVAWSALPAALGDIVYATANAVITGVQNMINRVSETINGYISSINAAMKSLPFGLGDSISIGTIGPVSLGGISNPYAGAADAAQSAIGGAISDAMSFDYVGSLGAVITEGASAASEKLKEVADGLTNVEAAAGKAGGAGKKAGEDTAKGFDTAKAAMKQAEEAMGFAKDVTKGFISDLKSGLKNGEGFFKSFANAAVNALDKIADKFLDNALNSLFGGGGMTGGGGGGLLSGLFGSLFGGGQMAAARAGNLLPGLYADGTASARAGMAIVGEEGPEVVRFRGGEQVIPNHQLRAANTNRNTGQSGGGGRMQVDVGVSVDNNGNLQAYVKNVSEGTSKNNLAAYSKNQQRAGFGNDQKIFSSRKG